MRKYRVTKITIKTKEIISTAKNTPDSTCPFCHQPVSALPPANESSVVSLNTKKQTAELPPAKVTGNQ